MPARPAMPRTPALLCAFAALALALPAGAHAAYGPGADAASAAGAVLGSGQSDQPALSADGRYVVFTTAAPELLGTPPDPGEAYTNGIVRRDLLTGAVDVVAPPRRVRRADGAETYAGATSAGASISADGRYVIFRSAVALTDGDRNTGSDVYVRDMSKAPTASDAYTLVSALDGTTDAPTYTGGSANAGARPGARGYAISADGRTAVFATTTAASNLPAGGAATTPPDQVFVRHLDTGRTELVTRARTSDGPVPRADGDTHDPAPVLSADGTTVAWQDPDAAAQVPMLPGEPNPAAAYLWRDLAAPAPVTRRVAGTGDLNDPACDPSQPFDADDAASGPCAGPFVAGGEAGGENRTLAPLSISGDGRLLLFRTDAFPRPRDPTLDRAGSVYLADMSPGVSRKAGVRRILSIPGTNANGLSLEEPLLSRDGRRVAFLSNATVFDGGRQLGDVPTAGQGGLGLTNVYVLDRDAGTIQRATAGFDGTDYHGDLVDPTVPGAYADPAPASLTTDATMSALAFSADDGNLFRGDANGARDVQVVHGTPGLAAVAGAPTALPAPEVARLPLVWAQSVQQPLPTHPVIGYVTVGKDGIARIVVRVPAAGTLTATATAKPVAHAARVTVARAASRPRSARTVTLKLALTKAAKAALRKHTLKVRAAVRFKPRAGAAASATRTYTLKKRAARR